MDRVIDWLGRRPVNSNDYLKAGDKEAFMKEMEDV